MRILEILFAAAVIAFLSSAVIGYLLERPVFVSYVTSDSMKPTLERGDVFFINPFAKPEAGDIVVFRNGNHWVVHRVVAVGENIVTKGDANLATDLPVRAEDVAGVVVTLFGSPVRIPKVGDYIAATSAKANNVVVATVLLILGASLLSGNERRKKKRGGVLKLRFRTLMAAASALVVSMFIISILASWGTVSFSYVSTLAGGQREGWYLPGSEFEEEITIGNRWIVPMHYVLQPVSDRVTLEETAFTLIGEREVGVRVEVPEDTRIYTERVNVYSYPPLLPLDTVENLYAISPYAPLFAMLFEVTLLLAALYAAGGNDEVFRIRARWTRWIR